MPTKTLRIAAVQLKFRPTVAANLGVICGFIANARRAGCDVLLFPECALTGYNVDFNNVKKEEIKSAFGVLADAARFNRCNVLIGSPTWLHGKRFNSLLVLDRRGRITFQYNKTHLTKRDAQFFEPGNSVAFFHIDSVPCTAIICHERRYPELVRLPVMMGAQIVFHPNAGLDKLAVSKTKRRGRDGITTRAFENQIFYVFANSVGPQGNNLWSAGDSKIVAPDSRLLALANNRDEMMIHTDINLAEAARKYAQEALLRPAFLRTHWKKMLATCRKQLRRYS